MTSLAELDTLSPQQLRLLAAELIVKVGQRDSELLYRQTRIDLLTQELTLLKRFRDGKRSEQLDAGQASLPEESVDADLAALEIELEALQPAAPERKPGARPKRAPLPAELPRTDIHHEPDDVMCAAASGYALAKMSARSSTTRPACSRSNAIFAASGSASLVKR